MENECEVKIIDIPVIQGDCVQVLLEFFDPITGDPVDCSSWDFAGDVRDFYQSSTVLAEWAFSQVGYDTNQMLASLTATQTQALIPAPQITPGKYPVKKFDYSFKTNLDTDCWYTIQRGAILFTGSGTPDEV